MLLHPRGCPGKHFGVPAKEGDDQEDRVRNVSLGHRRFWGFSQSRDRSSALSPLNFRVAAFARTRVFPYSGAYGYAKSKS